MLLQHKAKVEHINYVQSRSLLQYIMSLCKLYNNLSLILEGYYCMDACGYELTAHYVANFKII